MLKNFRRKALILAALALILGVYPTLAQEQPIDAASILPASHLMTGFTYHPQMWNNCGPATLTTALSYFGYNDNQVRAANWLKPNREDKNVSPWQMVEYVNTQVPEIPVFATVRYGGTLDRLRTLTANNFPVIIEAGYDPERAAQGWMGHYLLVIGYDDTRQQFTTHDSYDGANLAYSYDHIQEVWQHFNYTYIILYTINREAELMELLGIDADPELNVINAFYMAQDEAEANPDNAFAWFNMGSNLVMLDLHLNAAAAYDQARNLGLPWRMLWYQFGPYEAYYAVGRYQDMLTLANAVLNDGGGQYVEESYYYAGMAREGLGETQRAINNYNEVLRFNPNFTPAQERRDALLSGG